MNTKAKLRTAVDAVMIILLMLLMAFELVGRRAHEWIGTGMFVLFIVHHALNRKWTGNLLRGSYTPYRVLQTVLAALVLLAMAGAMVSAVLISREVFAFLPIRGGRMFGRTLHMLSAYWGFVLMALHLGLHWSMMMGRIRNLAGVAEPSGLRRLILRILGAVTAGYGLYVFATRDLAAYMFLRTEFVFLDYSESPISFYIDYLAMMGLFIWTAYYLSMFLQKFLLPERNRT